MPLLPDSCAWIEVAADDLLAPVFLDYLASPDLVVPTIVQYEVCRWLLRFVDEETASRAPVLSAANRIVPLSAAVAFEAAVLSRRHRLPMADAIVLATGHIEDAQVVTSDSHLKGLPGVIFVPGKEYDES